MEFKTKAALTEWANGSNDGGNRSLLQRAAGREASQKFESRDMAVTRIWTAVSRDKPNVARKPKAGRKRRQPKTRKASKPGS